MTKKKISVLGAGSWGATLATHLHRLGHEIVLWEFDPKIAKGLDTTRRLTVLPALKIPAGIRITSSLKETFASEPDVLLSVVPSHFVRSTMEAIKKDNLFPKRAPVVSASKGIEQKTLLRMTQVIREVCPESAGRLAVLSGPSHAEEVALGLPTAVDIAAENDAVAQAVIPLFMGETLRVYSNPDPIGVELGGALKNVYAIACGIADGLKLGDNAKAALITRGLLEMGKLGKRLGARVETFFGLAGVGDLIVTCSSLHSRNRSLGEKIGQGKNLKTALSEMTMVAEGVKTCESAYQLAQANNVNVPLIQEVYLCLYKGKKALDSLHDLLHRAVHSEMEGLFK